MDLTDNTKYLYWVINRVYKEEIKGGFSEKTDSWGKYMDL